MPTVPEITAKAGGPSYISPPHATGEVFGTQLGSAMIGAGQSLKSVADRMQHQRDDIAVSRIAAQFMEDLVVKSRAVLQDPSITGNTLDEIMAAKSQALHDYARDRRRELTQGESDAVQQAMMVYENQHIATAAIGLRTDVLKQEAERQSVDFAAVLQRNADLAALNPAAEISFLNDNRVIADRAKAEKVLPDAFIHEQQRAALDRFWRQKAVADPHRVLGIQADVVAGGAPPAGMDQGKLAEYAHIANLAIAGQRADEERARTEAARVLKEQQDATRQQFVSKWANKTLNSTEILLSNLPASGEGSKEHYLKLLEAQAKAAAEAPKFVKDPVLRASLFSQIRQNKVPTLDVLDTAYIHSAQVGRGIDDTDLTELQKVWRDFQTPDGRRLGEETDKFLKGVKSYIDKTVMDKVDPEGSYLFSQYAQYVDQQIAAVRQAGGNPYELFDPSSSKYLWSDGIKTRWQRSLDDTIRSFSEKLERPNRQTTPDAVEPRKPGETPEEYRKRVPK